MFAPVLQVVSFGILSFISAVAIIIMVLGGYLVTEYLDP